jgi:hypothetical protein
MLWESLLSPHGKAHEPNDLLFHPRYANLPYLIFQCRSKRRLIVAPTLHPPK